MQRKERGSRAREVREGLIQVGYTTHLNVTCMRTKHELIMVDTELVLYLGSHILHKSEQAMINNTTVRGF